MKITTLLTALFFSTFTYTNSFCQQLVLRGDYPDPSVVKVGDTYWASATTSNWLPAYPLLKSKDLINWQHAGYVFNQKPDWADYYFWAPEITYDNGKVYVYYAAHKKGGNLCVGVAAAEKPEGPYTDLGPLVCQEDGSIDAFPMRDEKGTLHLVWKEDANSIGKPTPIWMQELSEDRTALKGEKKELFRNNAPWEGNLVEGVSMMRHGTYFYAFYAAAGCCGKGCTYTTGVARSERLEGPWEKYEKNPVLVNDDVWKCPGHGTPVEKGGKFYFMYHAYNKESDVYTGREALVQEFRFTADNWIEFIKENAPAKNSAVLPVNDNFNGHTLSSSWQWNVFQPVEKKLRRGRLTLAALPTATGAFLGRKTRSGNYTATTRIRAGRSDAATGLGVIGDERNTIAVLRKGDSVYVLQVRDDKESIVAAISVPVKKKVYLQLQVRHGKDLTFLYSTSGTGFVTLNKQAADGSFLPPWDRAVRVGLISKGGAGKKSVFDDFQLQDN